MATILTSGRFQLFISNIKHEYFMKKELVHSNFKQIKNVLKRNIVELVDSDNLFKTKVVKYLSHINILVVFRL